MELAFFIWLAGVLANLGALFVLSGIAGFAFMLFAWVANETAFPKSEKKKFIWKGKAIVFAGLMFIGCFTPSERTAWLMAAGYYGQEAVQSEEGKKMVELAKKRLEELLEEKTK